MRQETNNEMDLLLRRLGRQETVASTEHLDADELSSYAENVLPSAARARYTEHLAECASCRDLVVQLSSSAGVVAAQETAKVSELSGLRKFLASLFSPMVLRYAVPALGLVIIAAIGLMVSRQQPQRESSISQVMRQEEQAKAPVPASEPQQSSSPAGFVNPTENATPANKRTAQSSDTESGPAPPPNVPPTVNPITTEVDQSAATKKVEQQPADKEAPAAPKTVAVTDAAEKLDADVRKQKAEDRAVIANEAPPVKAPEESKREARTFGGAEAARSRSMKRGAEPSGVATGAAGAGRSEVQRDDAAEKDKNDTDIRTVAGRRFRKQGNVWIDTAYNSSSSTTNLTRGSEQYRALVADEPAIKTIADQLDGEIIVVWKGRTYRIR